MGFDTRAENKAFWQNLPVEELEKNLNAVSVEIYMFRNAIEAHRQEELSKGAAPVNSFEAQFVEILERESHIREAFKAKKSLKSSSTI